MALLISSVEFSAKIFTDTLHLQGWYIAANINDTHSLINPLIRTIFKFPAGKFLPSHFTYITLNDDYWM